MKTEADNNDKKVKKIDLLFRNAMSLKSLFQAKIQY